MYLQCCQINSLFEVENTLNYFLCLCCSMHQNQMILSQLGPSYPRSINRFKILKVLTKTLGAVIAVQPSRVPSKIIWLIFVFLAILKLVFVLFMGNVIKGLLEHNCGANFKCSPERDNRPVS